MRYTWIKSIICVFVTIMSVNIVDRNLEVVYRDDQPCFAAVYPACKGHTRIWKKIYKGKPGEVYLWKTIEGKLTEERVTSTPEKIEWPEK